MRDRLATDYGWTRRQRQVLDLIAAGRSNLEIADTLGISRDGAKYHVSEVLSKLGADSREEAADYWRRYNGMAPRFARVFRGALSLKLLPWLAGAAAAAGLAVAIVVALRSGDGDQPAADPSATVTPQATTTPAPTAEGERVPVRWSWNSGLFNVTIWVRSGEGNIAASWSGIADAPAGGIALLDEQSGRERWRLRFNAAAFPALMAGNQVFVGLSDGSVLALNAADGREQWRTTFDGVPFQLAFAGGALIVADGDPALRGSDTTFDRARLAGHIWAFDRRSGQVLWRRQEGSSNAFLAVANDAVVVAAQSSTNSAVVARLNVGDGSTAWERRFGAVSSPPVIAGDQVVVAAGKLESLDLASGAVRWEQESGERGDFVFPGVAGEFLTVGTATGPAELRETADGSEVAWAEGHPSCSIRPPVWTLATGSQVYVLRCGGLWRFVRASGGNWVFQAVFTPQGAMKDADHSLGGVVFSTGIGTAPDGVEVLDP